MNTNRQLRKYVHLLPACVFVLVATGCKSDPFREKLDFAKSIPWTTASENREPAGRVVGYWSDTMMAGPGKPTERGFGGRVYFYPTHSEKPVEVDGRLVVYAFDETHRDPSDKKPTRRYVFPADQLQKHYSESDLGPSYSFWLPWDQAGGPQADITLITRFETADGRVLVSKEAKQRLEGTQIAENKSEEVQPYWKMAQIVREGQRSPQDSEYATQVGYDDQGNPANATAQQAMHNPEEANQDFRRYWEAGDRSVESYDIEPGKSGSLDGDTAASHTIPLSRNLARRVATPQTKSSEDVAGRSAKPKTSLRPSSVTTPGPQAGPPTHSPQMSHQAPATPTSPSRVFRPARTPLPARSPFGLARQSEAKQSGQPQSALGAVQP